MLRRTQILPPHHRAHQIHHLPLAQQTSHLEALSLALAFHRQRQLATSKAWVQRRQRRKARLESKLISCCIWLTYFLTALTDLLQEWGARYVRLTKCFVIL